MEREQERNIAIVGGGIAGVTVFIALVGVAADSMIIIVEPGPIGIGVAFANTESALQKFVRPRLAWRCG